MINFWSKSEKLVLAELTLAAVIFWTNSSNPEKEAYRHIRKNFKETVNILNFAIDQISI
ncbi:Uncharacterized protein dnm_059100 [Desulfonema magnum]|uniref:Uncharacterized protein n=1 Tax=Desulfonema magnum TaxID=45655 RepID=A0A975BR44_9BACT|nr:Uncharacterized protein dnm_059100 [Desulfonema magnum]